MPKTPEQIAAELRGETPAASTPNQSGQLAHPYLGMAIRGAAGLLGSEGMLPGAAISGGGEALAEMVEQGTLDPSKINPVRVATEAGIGAIPFAKVIKPGKGLLSAARGAALAGGGQAARDVIVEHKAPGMDVVIPAIVGGATAGTIGHFTEPRSVPPVPKGPTGDVPMPVDTGMVHGPAEQFDLNTPQGITARRSQLDPQTGKFIPPNERELAILNAHRAREAGLMTTQRPLTAAMDQWGKVASDSEKFAKNAGVPKPEAPEVPEGPQGVSDVSQVEKWKQRLAAVREGAIRQDPFSKSPLGNLTPEEELEFNQLLENELRQDPKKGGPLTLEHDVHLALLKRIKASRDADLNLNKSGQAEAANEFDQALKDQKQQNALADLEAKRVGKVAEEGPVTQTTTAEDEATGGKLGQTTRFVEPEPEPPVTAASGEQVPPTGPKPGPTAPSPQGAAPVVEPEVIPTARQMGVFEPRIDPSKVQAAAESLPYTESFREGEVVPQGQLPPGVQPAGLLGEGRTFNLPEEGAPGAPSEPPAAPKGGPKPRGKGKMPKLGKKTPAGFQQAVDAVLGKTGEPVPQAEVPPQVPETPQVTQAAAPPVDEPVILENPAAPPTPPPATSPLSAARGATEDLRPTGVPPTQGVLTIGGKLGGSKGRGGIFMSPEGVFGKANRLAEAAQNRGENVPQEGVDLLKRGFTQAKLQQPGAVTKAGIAKEAAQQAKDLSSLSLDQINAMKPEERASILQRILGQSGQVAPGLQQLGMHVGGGLIGSALGAAGDPEDRTRGALIGGTAGAAAPFLLSEGKMQMPSMPAAGDAIKAVLSRLPNIQRFNYLSNIPSLAANSVAAPVGLGWTSAMENMVGSDNPLVRTAGRKLMAQVPTLAKGAYTKFGEAGQLLHEGGTYPFADELSPFQRAGANPVDKALAIPATMITAAHKALVDAAENAGFSHDQALEFALANMPGEGSGVQSLRAFGKGVENLRSAKTEGGATNVIGKMLYPFAHTAANVAAATPERLPLAGILVGRKMLESPNSWRMIATQQGMSIPITYASYQLGNNMDPETARVARTWIRNLSGRYGAIAMGAFLAGQAARKQPEKYGPLGMKVVKGLEGTVEELPMSGSHFLEDWGKFGESLVDDKAGVRVPPGALPFGMGQETRVK